jgi:hypothetical protein
VRKLSSYLTPYPSRLIPDCIRNHPPTLNALGLFGLDMQYRSFWKPFGLRQRHVCLGACRNED